MQLSVDLATASREELIQRIGQLLEHIALLQAGILGVVSALQEDRGADAGAVPAGGALLAGVIYLHRRPPGSCG